MTNNRRNSPSALRFAERRRREDEAPRLRDQVPDLVSLELQIEETAGLSGTKHVRHVLVDRAPALFLVPCGDSRCADGEHDLTYTVMGALRAHRTSFEGTDACSGTLGTLAFANCGRVLRFNGVAVYRA
jgi:hypothetical protein